MHVRTDRKRCLPIKHKSLHSHIDNPPFMSSQTLYITSAADITYDLGQDMPDRWAPQRWCEAYQAFLLARFQLGPSPSRTSMRSGAGNIAKRGFILPCPLDAVTALGHNCGDSTVIFDVSDDVRLDHFNGPCSSITPSAERGAETPS